MPRVFLLPQITNNQESHEGIKTSSLEKRQAENTLSKNLCIFSYHKCIFGGTICCNLPSGMCSALVGVGKTERHPTINTPTTTKNRLCAAQAITPSSQVLSPPRVNVLYVCLSNVHDVRSNKTHTHSHTDCPADVVTSNSSSSSSCSNSETDDVGKVSFIFQFPSVNITISDITKTYSP